MKILAVDTSTMISSIAILENSRIIADCNINQKETHSEKLVPLIKRILDDLKMKLKDVDSFAISKGPGSFTGLRIGMTSLKAMSQALDKPIIGISTLKALAYSIYNNSYVCSLIDARANRYYAGLYHWDKGDLKEDFEKILTDDELFEILQDIENVVLVGEATEKLSKNILELKNISIAHDGLKNGIAKNVAVLARDRFEKKDFDDYFTIEPNYLRKSQAEINFDKKSI